MKQDVLSTKTGESGEVCGAVNSGPHLMLPRSRTQLVGKAVVFCSRHRDGTRREVGQERRGRDTEQEMRERCRSSTILKNRWTTRTIRRVLMLALKLPRVALRASHPLDAVAFDATANLGYRGRVAVLGGSALVLLPRRPCRGLSCERAVSTPSSGSRSSPSPRSTVSSCSLLRPVLYVPRADGLLPGSVRPDAQSSTALDLR
jgi:hypothetical protein